MCAIPYLCVSHCVAISAILGSWDGTVTEDGTEAKASVVITTDALRVANARHPYAFVSVPRGHLDLRVSVTKKIVMTIPCLLRLKDANTIELVMPSRGDNDAFQRPVTFDAWKTDKTLVRFLVTKAK